MVSFISRIVLHVTFYLINFLRGSLKCYVLRPYNDCSLCCLSRPVVGAHYSLLITVVPQVSKATMLQNLFQFSIIQQSQLYYSSFLFARFRTVDLIKLLLLSHNKFITISRSKRYGPFIDFRRYLFNCRKTRKMTGKYYS